MNSSGKSGIGIGLSNSKSLVEALAGEIDIQSRSNKGTIVQFSVDIVLKKEKEVITKRQIEEKLLNNMRQD